MQNSWNLNVWKITDNKNCVALFGSHATTIFFQKGLAFVAIPSGAAVVWAATKAKAATGKADEEGHDSLQHQQVCSLKDKSP